jgi:hypothetical protein
MVNPDSMPNSKFPHHHVSPTFGDTTTKALEMTFKKVWVEAEAEASEEVMDTAEWAGPLSPPLSLS